MRHWLYKGEDNESDDITVLRIAGHLKITIAAGACMQYKRGSCDEKVSFFLTPKQAYTIIGELHETKDKLKKR